MSEEYFVKFCSPTLAGLKTGSIFTYLYSDEEEVMASIRKLNKELVPKGISVIPLKMSDGRAIIYIYRPKKLKHDLNNEMTSCTLKKYGYCTENHNRCIAKLSDSLKCSECSSSFPHEIGFFLGYPPEDVIGFIEKKVCPYNLNGFWKVYTNPEKAERQFTLYRKCTKKYCELWNRGVSLNKLAVAVK